MISRFIASDMTRHGKSVGLEFLTETERKKTAVKVQEEEMSLKMISRRNNSHSTGLTHALELEHVRTSST